MLSQLRLLREHHDENADVDFVGASDKEHAPLPKNATSRCVRVLSMKNKYNSRSAQQSFKEASLYVRSPKPWGARGNVKRFSLFALASTWNVYDTLLQTHIFLPKKRYFHDSDPSMSTHINTTINTSHIKSPELHTS